MQSYNHSEIVSPKMTLQIDRLEIADTGGNPIALAKSVTAQLKDLKPPIPVREIASAVNIYKITEAQLDAIEGMLITSPEKSDGEILINERRPEKRKRYTIAHELGHFLNEWHKPPTADGFRCSARDMAAEAYGKIDRTLKMEVEANQFAAELLMPSDLFHRHPRLRSFVDLNNIIELSDDFDVSREAVGRRYLSFANEPLAIVFSKSGVIRYIKKHDNFPPLCVWNKDLIPEQSLSKASQLPTGEVSQWRAANADVWLRNFNGSDVCEQTLAQSNGYRMTLLALEEQIEDDEDEETNWDPPKFRR